MSFLVSMVICRPYKITGATIWLFSRVLTVISINDGLYVAPSMRGRSLLGEFADFPSWLQRDSTHGVAA